MESPKVWFPTFRAGTGADVFTERLVNELNRKNIRAEITWVPRRAEYLPWSVCVPKCPDWANIIHVNTWFHTRFLPKDLPIIATSHLCVHDTALDPYKSSLQKIYHRYWIKPLETALLHRAHRVVAVSHYTAHSTKSVFNLGEVKVIHNGLPISLGKDPECFHVVHRPFRLLYVGNWSMRKGTDLLPVIMEELGEGFELWYTSDFHNQDKKIKLPKNCFCIGRLNSEELSEIYKSCDALLFPSRLEGLSLSVLEAMQHELPVITSNSSSMGEIVLAGESGFLCAQDTIQDFVNAARSLAKDLELWRHMRKSASERVRNYFSLERMAAEYVSLYTDCLISKSNSLACDSTKQGRL